MKRKKSLRKPDKSQGDTSIALTTDRAIFLQGEIGEELFRILTPQILRLKEDNSRRITVFIDSPGGSPVHAGRILGLLRSVDDSGQRPEIVTVATGEACSAAADLLSQGDYVMAFRHANLHFHGTRMTDSGITRKYAEELEAGLEWADQEAARRLSLGVFERFLRLYVRHAEQVANVREKGGMFVGEYDDLVGKGIFDIPALIGVLHDKVGDDAGGLLHESLHEMRRIKGVLEVYQGFVDNKIDSVIFGLVASRIKGERKKSRMQLRVLEAVIASRLAGEETWDLRAKSFQEIEADFIQVFALAEDIWHDDLLDLLLKHEYLFFSAKDSAKMEALKASLTMEQFEDDKNAQAQLDAAVGRAYRKAEPLWQYVSTFSRKLNEGENEINPEDAWHLGLIDEVIGLPLAHRELDRHQTDAMQQSLNLADTAKFMQ